MERQYIKISEYARFTGKSKQSVYQSKRIKRTTLPNGSTVIMMADLPAEQVKALNQFLDGTLIDGLTTNEAVDKSSMQAEIDALKSRLETYEQGYPLLEERYDAAAAEAEELREKLAAAEAERDALAGKLSMQEQLLMMANERCKNLEQMYEAAADHSKKMEELCTQANVLMLQKIPNANSWSPKKLLPWNWGKTE